MSGVQPYPVTTRSPRPPLPASMRRSARLAGGVGFVLMSVGWGLFGLAALVGVVALFLTGAFAVMSANNPSLGRQLAEAERSLARLPLALIVGVLVAAGVLGAILWVAGLCTSAGILRRSGHPRPWAVTWAGLGLGIVASWIGSLVAQAVGQVAGTAVALPAQLGNRQGLASAVGDFVTQGVVWLVVLAALHVVAGVLLWWWMAWAMRPAAVSDRALP